MTVGGYSVRSIGNYVREMRFIFEYYPDVSPADLTAKQIEVYICYIKKTFNSGFSKCRLVASSVLFYFKQILRRQQLSFHPHIHCIVSGGGIDKDKGWKEAVKAKHKFLFPTKAVQEVYRAYFLKQLQKQIDKGHCKDE